MPLSIGQVIHNNRYKIDALLGQGGMGAVYRAWDMSLNIPMAIKENLDASPEAQKQFGREAHLLARLSHPNLPRVTDYFFIPGQGQYLVMDFVEGEDLQAMLNRLGALPEPQVLNWISQVCDALAYLHSQPSPIIHRDIKPANIKIRPDGRAMLVDFGIAKVYDPHLATTIGAKAVTPGYSPPEQYGGGMTDARSDIYALGATLYHLLTGHQPPESVQRAVGSALILPPRQLNQQISPMVEHVILKAIEVATDRRFQSMDELRAALTQPVRDTTARPPVSLSGMIQSQPISQPRTMTQPQTAQPFPLLWLALVGGIGLTVIVLIIGVLAVSGALGNTRPTSTSVAVVVVTEQPIQAATATLRPTDRLRPSVTAMPSTDTPQASATAVPPAALPSPQPTVTPYPKTPTPAATAAPWQWPIVIFDRFNSNANGWWTGDNGSSIACQVVDGKYRCELKPYTAMAHWHWLGQTLATEFYLAVDAQHVSGGKDSEFSLMFRRVGNDHYLFSIRDDQTFRLIYYFNDTINPLIDWSKSDAIRPGQVNHLAVYAKGTHYTLFINNVRVGEVDDNRLNNGLAGLHVFSNTSDEPAVIEFDNYELRAP